MDFGTIAQGLQILSSAKSLFGGGDDDGGMSNKEYAKQFAWSAKSAREMPAQQVMGMRAAGLNPMLLATKGLPPAPGYTVEPGLETKMSTAKQVAGTQAALAAASIANQSAQAELYGAQAENVRADTKDKLLRPDETSARTNLLKAQVATEAWGPENRKWATELLSAQYNKTVAEKDAISIWQRKLSEALTLNYEATRRILEQDLRQARTKADVDEALLKIERLTSIGAEGLGAISGTMSSAGAVKRALDAAKPRRRYGTSSQSGGVRQFEETSDFGR